MGTVMGTAQQFPIYKRRRFLRAAIIDRYRCNVQPVKLRHGVGHRFCLPPGRHTKIVPVMENTVRRAIAPRAALLLSRRGRRPRSRPLVPPIPMLASSRTVRANGNKSETMPRTRPRPNIVLGRGGREKGCRTMGPRQQAHSAVAVRRPVPSSNFFFPHVTLYCRAASGMWRTPRIKQHQRQEQRPKARRRPQRRQKGRAGYSIL